MESSAGNGPGDRFVVVPPTDVSGEALRGLVEEFVSRDGTDYGDRERTLEEKVDRVKQKLASGEVCIVFDRDDERVNLVCATDLDAVGRSSRREANS